MFSESFSYYNTYNGTKRNHEMPSTDFPQKKRRLADHLSSLNLGNQPPSSTSSSTINPLFGQINTDTTSTDKFNIGACWNSYETPTKVFINNIDQFLRENPEKLEFIGNQMDGKTPLKGDIFIDKGVLKSAWDCFIAQHKSEVSPLPFSEQSGVSESDGNINQIVRNLIWKEFIMKYSAVIKYNDPLKLVWKQFLQWQEDKVRGKERIHEIHDVDYDDDMMIDEQIQNQTVNDGMSHYGSYYGEEHPWDQMQDQNIQCDGDINMGD